MFFVWVKGTTGPSPQKWMREITSDGRPVPALFKRKLTEHEGYMSIADLAKLYPCPEQPE